MPKHVAQQTATDAELYLGNQVAPGAPAAGGYLYAAGGLLYGRNVGGAAVDLLNQGVVAAGGGMYSLAPDPNVMPGGGGTLVGYARTYGTLGGVTVALATGIITLPIGRIWIVHYSSLLGSRSGARVEMRQDSTTAVNGVLIADMAMAANTFDSQHASMVGIVNTVASARTIRVWGFQTGGDVAWLGSYRQFVAHAIQ